MSGLWLWLRRALGGYKVLITYRMAPPDRFTEELHYSKVSEAQAYSMGYVRGRNIKDEARFIPFRIYVRFEPDAPPLPIPPSVIAGKEVPYRETASTFYEQTMSKSIEKFLNGMKAQRISSMDMKKLAMVGLIGAVAAIGIIFILMR